MSNLHVVTGAFGYSGRYITERLLRAGNRVRTLTNSPDREQPFGDRVEVHPFNFDYPERLATSLEGAQVLYNTTGCASITRTSATRNRSTTPAPSSPPPG